MDNPYRLFIDKPAMYRIRVYGRVSERWMSSYWDVADGTFQETAGVITTEMLVDVIDQGALIGMINTLYDRGHAIIAVERLTAEPNNGAGKEQTNR
jgi:hypothetical protein